MRKISQWVQSSIFFQIKLYSTEFIDNLLKLKMEMENLIHHAKFEMWPALCKC